MKPARVLALVLTTFAASESVATAQTPTSPPPPGIRVRAGDTVFIDGPDTVKIIRRRQAEIRAVYNPTDRWVIVVADYAADGAKSGDGRVDINYTFHDVANWPLGERWSGAAVIDEYFFAGQSMSAGIGLSSSGGYVQLLSSRDAAVFQDTAALAVFYTGFSRGGGGRDTMDLAEQRLIAQAQRSVQMRGNLPGGASDAGSGITFGVTGGGTAAGGVVATPGSAEMQTGMAPVRVGGNIRAPQKVHHVEAVMPDAAAKAGGIFGMVILEIIIGTDGRVSDVKVLRSIPLLDQAAIDAAKQWRYEITQLNGQPVPVIMTATVSFR